MRKALSILLVAALLVGVCSCGPQKPTPVATLTLADGRTIVMELYPDQAPVTVANFITLANAGYYDGLTFHRISPNYVIQGGDPRGDGTGGPGYSIKGEFSENGVRNSLKHTVGVVSMARSQGNDTAGSQFFIMLRDEPQLDGKYAAFGKVADEESLQVVQELGALPQTAEKPEEPPVIKSIRVDTKGESYQLTADQRL